ncbi:substrate-binding domain-containing protein [Niveibacterium sp. SC-1]|uniref:LacI family DNA-binding transcriptional regulator n=1 Tax=Niveibacterium sp. SC-1 TaxID=3135646 RepID=UPI00311D4B56
MATIRDVARMAGVGVATASRVISGKGSVSLATAAKVHAAVKALDFRPSHPARALAARTYDTIGVFVPDIGGPYYPEILRVIDHQLRDHGRQMMVMNGGGPGTPREQVLTTLDFALQRGCDGLLLISQELRDEDFEAQRARMPRIATLNRIVPALGDGCFATDHYRGGQLAAEALLAQGHHKLAVISGPKHVADNRDRMRGFYATARAAGIPKKAIPCVEGDFSPESGWLAAGRLLELGQPFTGLFVANDEMAIAALSRFQTLGVNVPHEVSVVAYDDIKSGAFSAPPVTTVHIPFVDMAYSAVNWLLNACYGMTLPVQRDFPVSLTERASLRRVALAAVS